MRMKVLLLNPPGRKIYIRDYYCSKVSRSNYVYPPPDLLMLSGRLAESCELHAIDAIADRIGPAECRALIDRMNPDVVISLIGAVSLEEDCAFLESIRARGRRILVSGDVVLDHTTAWLEAHRFVDAVILDFTSAEILRYIDGEESGLHAIATARDAAAGSLPDEEPVREFEVPVPRHELFSSPHYRFPFARQRTFSTILTDYGCPYGCGFCIMGTLGYRYRKVDNVMEELRYLRSLGKTDLFFMDQTFGARKERALDLCSRMCEERLSFGWTCFSRADILTDEMLDAMQAAGCNTVIMGVETASEDLLRSYRKGVTHDQVREALRRCASRGIRSVATFILGLPEETEATARATIELAKNIGCDFASFSIAVPRMRTPLRKQAIAGSLISPEMMTMDQTGREVAMPSQHLTKEQLEGLIDAAVREFYFRPSYLWKRLRSLSTPYEFREHLAEGWALLQGLLSRGRDKGR